MNETTERYRVSKASGSRYALVVDTATGKTVERFDVLRANGWDKADKMRDRLNEADAALTTPGE